MRIFLLAAEIDYYSLTRYLQLPKPSGPTLRWMLVVFLGAVLLFVLYEIIARLVRQSGETKKSEEDFDQLTLVCGLTPEETRLLKHLVGICNIKRPDRLLTSFEFFNQCLEEKGPAVSGPVTPANAERLRAVRNKIFFGERSRQMPIKSTRELGANQRLHIKRLSTGEVYMTPVVDTGQTGLLVATPREGNEYMEVETGERLEVYFWRERDAGYTFETVVVGQSGAHYLITILKHVDNIERSQRRQFHRVSVLIPVTAIPVVREELDKVSCGEDVDTEKYPGLDAYIVDMSGTGFAFASRTSLSADDLVYIELPPEKGASAVSVLGKILNVTKKEPTDEYLMHAEFVGLSADTQERVLQFIYSQAKRGISRTV